MIISLKRRHTALLFGFMVAASASVWTYWQQVHPNDLESSAEVALNRHTPPRMSPQGADPVPAIDLQSMQRPAFNEVGHGDLFAVTSWQAQPSAPLPQPTPQALPVAPSAPVLPFRYLGRQEEPGAPGATVIYLSKGQEAYAVRVGDKLDNEYQLDGIEGGVLQFTYLPLSTKQMLSIGMDL